MMESDNLFCVVCSAQITQDTNPPPPADNSSSSNYLYFSQFCNELEKCGGGGGGTQSDKSFNAKQFFHSVDIAASYLLVCCDCKQLVSQAMELRVNLEKWEMEVLKLQIELLMKLKELESCNDNYFNRMSRIYDRAIKAVKDDDDLGKGIFFGECCLSKDDVNLFREKIIHVVPTLALFRDDLARKLVKPLKSPPAAASSSQPSQPTLDLEVGETETADDFQPMEIDSFKDDPFSKEDNVSSDNDNDHTNYQDNHFDDQDFHGTDEEEADSSDAVDDDSTSSDSSEDLEPKIPKKKPKMKTTDLVEAAPRPLPFPVPDHFTKYKKSLIEYISTPAPPSITLDPPFTCESVYPCLLQKYPWNYTPTSDTLSLGGVPITVKDGNPLTLECSTCNFSAVYKDNPFTSWQASVFLVARRIFEHIVSSHLEGFKCPIPGNKCRGKMSLLKTLTAHLTTSHDKLRAQRIKKETDREVANPNDDVDTELAPNPPKKLKKKKKKRRKGKGDPKISRIYDDLPPPPLTMPQDATAIKKLLIQNIQIAPLSSAPSVHSPISTDLGYTFMLQSYPWNYDPTSDTLTLGADIPIPVLEAENGESIELKCSKCSNFSTVYDKNLHSSRDQRRHVFGMVKKMWEHVLISHLDGIRCPLSPDQCTRKMGDIGALCKHLMRSHGGRRRGGLFHCSICGKGLTSLQTCLEHEDKHKDKQEREHVTCETCGKNLLKSSLPQHKKFFCDKKEPPTICQICGVGLSRKWTIKGHMLRMHAGEEVRRFGCDVEGCGKGYAVEIDLKNHKIRKHKIYPEGVEVECRKGCGRKFAWALTCCKHEERCDGKTARKKYPYVKKKDLK